MSFRKWVLLLIVLYVILLAGCSKEAPVNAIEKVRQVSVVTVVNETYKDTVRYTGFVSASQIIPLSFIRDGKVDEVKFKEGQSVNMGDALVTLEKTDSDSEVDTLYASMDGIVTEIVNQPGELIGAGRTVVILRSKKQIMNIGVTDVDVQRIIAFKNPVVFVDFQGEVVSATLDNIGNLPDSASRTYTVTIALDEKESYLMGLIGTVSFEFARLSGIWIPITNIQNDGEDFVYIVNAENRVERKNLRLKQLNNDLVRVEGLDEGNRIITVGNSFVKEGQLVNAREASNE